MQVLFFASLRDDVGHEALTLPVDGPTRLSALCALLAERLSPAAMSALTASNVRVAVDQELADEADPLIAPDAEVAFLPPVTGG